MKTRYTPVMAKGTTCSRQYGYTLKLEPPKVLTIAGNDVEGIGWVEYPRPVVQVMRFQGWYKYKSDAQSRAAELNYRE